MTYADENSGSEHSQQCGKVNQLMGSRTPPILKTYIHTNTLYTPVLTGHKTIVMYGVYTSDLHCTSV